MFLAGIISNISFLIVLSFIYSFLYQYQRKNPAGNHPLMTGFLFGFIALAGMLVPMKFSPGIIFDGRSIILSIGAFFGGPIVAVISVVITASFRFYIGGSGALTGIGVIVTSAVLGLLFRCLLDRKKSRKAFYLYLLGISVHICMLLWMLALPGKASRDVLRELSVPILLIYPLATVLVAKMLIDREIYIDNQEMKAASEEKFRSFFETSNVGNSITLPNGEIHVNQAFCDMLGYNREELQNKTWQELTPSDEITSIQKLVDPLLKREKVSVRFIKRYIHKDGSFIWADVSTRMKYDADGKPQYFITTIIDITDRLKAEEELREIKDNLEKEVVEKTRELKERISELERFHDATIEREIRMNELREEIKRLRDER